MPLGAHPQIIYTQGLLLKYMLSVSMALIRGDKKVKKAPGTASPSMIVSLFSFLSSLYMWRLINRNLSSIRNV